MSRILSSSEKIRAYIFRNIKKPGIAAEVALKFSISRQAANLHLKKLAEEGTIVPDGNTTRRTYKLARTFNQCFRYELKPGLQEDEVWTRDIRPIMGNMLDNVADIWHWAFTEMFNNAMDHSEGTYAIVAVTKTALSTEIMISDDGVGIFKKIQNALNLSDERQSIFELAKGKLTTDKANHSGQGIFFTSRMVNNFNILSGGFYFSHEMDRERDWMIEKDQSEGTTVFMKVDNHTARTVNKTLDNYSVRGSYDFNKTIVPVGLAKYGADQLVSRSQAKRVLARVDLFAQVIFDFKGVESIGKPFADQIFRVYANEHPAIQLLPLNASAQIKGIIQAVIKEGRPGFAGVRDEDPIADEAATGLVAVPSA